MGLFSADVFKHVGESGYCAIVQVYFPKLGRTLWLPAMLEKHHLPDLLKKDRHLHVLELTCAQFAPDSADYIRVSSIALEQLVMRLPHCKLEQSVGYKC